MTALIAIQACIILALVWVLLAGQPEAQAQNLQQITAQSTEVARLQATVAAVPRPTPQRCYFGSRQTDC